MSYYDMLRAGSAGGASKDALAEVINSGPKNLLTNTKGNQTSDTLTFTLNSDDTVTAAGTASRTVNTDYHINSSLALKAGTYVLSGCPAGGDNSSTYKIQISGVGYDSGESLEFTLAADTTIDVYVRIWKGYLPSNVVFKPMICTKAEWEASKAYVPYAPTNRELYEMILAMQG